MKEGMAAFGYVNTTDQARAFYKLMLRMNRSIAASLVGEAAL